MFPFSIRRFLPRFSFWDGLPRVFVCVYNNRRTHPMSSPTSSTPRPVFGKYVHPSPGNEEGCDGVRVCLLASPSFRGSSAMAFNDRGGGVSRLSYTGNEESFPTYLSLL